MSSEDLEQKRKALAEKKAKLEALKAKRKELQEKSAALDAQDRALSAPTRAPPSEELTRLKAQLADTQAKEKVHLSKIHDLRLQMQALQSKLTAEETELAKLQPQLSSLRSQIAAVDPASSSLAEPSLPASSSSSYLPTSTRAVLANEISYRPRQSDLALHKAMLHRDKFGDELISYLIWTLDETIRKVVVSHKEMITWQRGDDEKKQTKDWQTYTFTKLESTLVGRKEPCFVTCDYRYLTSDDRVSSKPIFISWIPPGTPLKVARLYGSLSTDLKNKHYFDIAKVIEASEVRELQPSLF
eukprot:g19535.t1